MNLAAEKLCLNYGDTTIFRNLSLSLGKGEILALKGANGSGKSSLCLCLGGLIGAERGIEFRGGIFYDKKPLQTMTIGQRCRAVGMIFQNPDNQLFSPLVIEELAFAPENLALPRAEIIARIDEALTLCGIEHLRKARTNSLSGGEKQLVAIASVLTMKPAILIADEITSRIDREKKETVRKILLSFAAQGGGVILVSHNPQDLAIATKTIELEKGKDYENRA